REARILEKQARQLREPQKIELYAGFGLSSLSFITPLLAKFKQINPDITVHIDDMPSNTMEDKLLLGELDLAFSRLPIQAPLKGLQLAQERLMLAIPIQNITVLEIDDNPLRYFDTLGLIQLVPEKGRKLYQQIQDFLKQHQINPRVLQQSQDIQTQLALVAAGLGMAFVPKSAELICDKQKVTLLPLSGLYTQWEIGVIWNDNIKNKDRDLFIKIISEEIDTL
ncbi:LysR family substrate-binding domain-containing protein, partial [Proteus sp. FME41]|uniref:LysR family substrate-binding domain-containing protein n=1 Tax=Proteus sp. FME41 TaxID=2742608 RepID=UPI001866E9F3